MLSFGEQMKRWAMIADRPINSFEQMMIARPFKFDAQHQTWSRTIKPVYSGLPLGVIELTLTPVNPSDPKSWRDQVNPMRMRLHGMSVSESDKFHASLPDEVFQSMIDQVGREQAVFMITCDLWPYMDLPKLMQERKKATSPLGIAFDAFRLRGTEGMRED